MQVLGAPETRLQEVDMVLGGENDNGLKNHLHKKFKPPESEGGCMASPRGAPPYQSFSFLTLFKRGWGTGKSNPCSKILQNSYRPMLMA